MDPDITLQELRLAVANYLDSGDSTEAHQACDLFQALDEWLIRGGFVPTSWGSIRLTGEGC